MSTRVSNSAKQPENQSEADSQDRTRLKGEFRSPEGDIHKVVRISRKDINEATQLLKGRDATEDEVRRSKDFFRKNSLPSNFEERKQLVEKLIETTYQEPQVSREDRRTVMKLLYRKEKEAMEQRERNGIADRDKETKETSSTTDTNQSVGPALTDSVKNEPSIPNTFLNDASLSAQDIQDLAEIVGPSSPSQSNANQITEPPAAAPVAQAAAPAEEDSVPQQQAAAISRAGHSGPAPIAPALVLPDPIVILPGGGSRSGTTSPPPVANFDPARLKANLEKVLEGRVRNGELSATEGKEAMKDLLTKFNDERDGKEPKLPRTARIDAAKTTPDVIPGKDVQADAEAENAKKNPGVIPQGITVFGNSGSSASIPVAGDNADLVANEMSKILTDFGQLSLEPDGGKAKKPGDTGNGKSGGMVGVMSASGGDPISPSDNSGNTPAILTKSGGTLVLAGKESSTAAAVVESPKGWLHAMVSKYLARKNGSRALASPSKGGLPQGSLSPKDPEQANFVPNGAMGLVEATTGGADATNDADWFMWLGGGALSLSTYWAMRRRKEETPEEDERRAS